MLKSLAFIVWSLCIVVLLQQMYVWLRIDAWHSLTLMDAMQNLFGWDVLSMASRLPLDLAVKGAYLLFTTGLAQALWWMGAAFMALHILANILMKG